MKNNVKRLNEILTSVPEIHGNLRKEGPTSLCGPCPKCGGDDRFVYKTDSKIFWCRNCYPEKKPGNKIGYHMWVEGLDFKRLLKKYLPEPKAFEHPQLGFPVEKYAYTDEISKVLYYACRFEPKAFRQCSADGISWSVKNMKPKVPYQLFKVVGAKTVYILNGEKACNKMNDIDQVGTCNIGGEGNWTSDLNKYFKGKEVFLLPDNDAKGRKHVEKVYSELKDVAASIKVIELPGLPEKGDFVDWIDTFDDIETAAEQLSITVENAGPYEPTPSNVVETGFNAAELMLMELPEPKWAIQGILPEGLNILAGKPRMGKSVISLNIAIAIASGGKALGKIDVEKGGVLYLALEDTKRRLKSRLTAMLLESPAPANLHIETAWPKIDDDGLSKLEKRIQGIPDLRLVIIDTLKKVRPVQRNRNSNPYDLDYDHVSAIKELADKFNIAMLVIHHLRKTQSEDIMDDFSGTFGLTGAADGLLAFKRKTGQADAELHIVGRDVDAAEYALKYYPDIWTWELIGDAQEVKSTHNRQLIYETIKNADEALTPKKIAALSGVKYWTVVKGLEALTADGSIGKSKYGKYKISAYR